MWQKIRDEILALEKSLASVQLSLVRVASSVEQSRQTLTFMADVHFSTFSLPLLKMTGESPGEQAR